MGYDYVDKRWDQAEYEDVDDNDLDNSSARLFERSRIKALAGMTSVFKVKFEKSINSLRHL